MTPIISRESAHNDSTQAPPRAWAVIAVKLHVDTDNLERPVLVSTLNPVFPETLSAKTTCWIRRNIIVIDGRGCIIKLIGPSVQYENASKSLLAHCILSFQF